MKIQLISVVAAVVASMRIPVPIDTICLTHLWLNDFESTHPGQDISMFPGIAAKWLLKINKHHQRIYSQALARSDAYQASHDPTLPGYYPESSWNLQVPEQPTPDILDWPLEFQLRLRDIPAMEWAQVLEIATAMRERGILGTRDSHYRRIFMIGNDELLPFEEEDNHYLFDVKMGSVTACHFYFCGMVWAKPDK